MKHEFDELWLKCVLPSLANLAWCAFERQGLTRKVRSYNAWEDAIAAAVHDMENCLDIMLSVDAPQATIDTNNTRAQAEGASWLSRN